MRERERERERLKHFNTQGNTRFVRRGWAKRERERERERERTIGIRIIWREKNTTPKVTAINACYIASINKSKKKMKKKNVHWHNGHAMIC